MCGVGVGVKVKVKGRGRIMNVPKIDMKSKWYKNCKRKREREDRICSECPFRVEIEERERDEGCGDWEFFGL